MQAPKCRRVRSALIAASFSLLATTQVPTASAEGPPQFTIRTVAGNGINGFAGDGGAATDAELNNPFTLAIDGSGNLYIADQLNHRIRRVSSSGTISTIAGDGTASSAGNGAAATNAQLSTPTGIAVDRSGNVYATDAVGSAVRKFSVGGNISTFAGNGTAAYTGDGGAASSASLNRPKGLLVDSSGKVYISDAANHRIRMVSTAGVITTVAGNGTVGYGGDGAQAVDASLNYPQGLAMDAAGNLYVADRDNHRVRKIAPDGVISTVAGTGVRGYSGDGMPATRSLLDYPTGVALDSLGNLYIADTFNSRIRVVTPDGSIWTVAGSGAFGEGGDGGPAGNATLLFPTGMATDANGSVYVADTQNGRIRLLTRMGNLSSAPVISTNGVVEATAFGGADAVSPGAWMEIYGENLAAVSREWSAADFNGDIAPTSLEGTTVSIGGKAAFLAYVSPNQINAQVPYTVSTGLQQVSVTTAAGTSSQYTVRVNSVQPGLCAPSSLKLGERQYVVALASDGKTLVLPDPGVPAIDSRAARPGDTITFYGVGFGPVTPYVSDGKRAGEGNRLARQFSVVFGETPATVLYAGLAPGSLGLYQFNVVVPAIPDNDAVRVKVTIDGVVGPQVVYTAVRN